MNVFAVIGAAFGDEGKGCVVNQLAHDDSLVIRFNGGAQAGHTVKQPSGKKHIFSHIGAGSFQGADTYLSRHFIVNPMLFSKEHSRLKHKGITPQIYIDEDAVVTLPYDMMINQSLERKRGDNKHGSCGVGIHETVLRSRIPVCAIRMEDLLYLKDHMPRIGFIVEEWFEGRVDELDLRGDTKMIEWFYNDNIIKHWERDVKYLLNNTHIVNSNNHILKNYKSIIFEGAQGLALSRDHQFFPHVTDSYTGLTNVIDIMKSAGIDETINVFYVTRPYHTRHGIGPLPHESSRLEYIISDDTNLYNEWQGSLRLAYLDIDFLKKTVQNDIDNNRYFPLNCNIALTCTNHLHNGVRSNVMYWKNDELLIYTARQFIHQVLPSHMSMPVVIIDELPKSDIWPKAIWSGSLTGKANGS